MSLFFGEELVGSRRVSVGPTNTASLVFVASQQTNGVFRMQLNSDDALAVDNTGSVLSALGRDVKALLVTSGNAFLEKALRSVPKLDLTVAATLTDPDPSADVRHPRCCATKGLAKRQRAGNPHAVDQLVSSQAARSRHRRSSTGKVHTPFCDL